MLFSKVGLISCLFSQDVAEMAHDMATAPPWGGRGKHPMFFVEHETIIINRERWWTYI